MDEETVEERIQLPVQRMVHQTVTHGGFMDMARFRIVDAEEKEKPRPIGDRGKEALATTKEKYKAGTPPVVRIRPIVVEPQPILVSFEVEDVRVAVGIGSVRRAIRGTACLQ